MMRNNSTQTKKKRDESQGVANGHVLLHSGVLDDNQFATTDSKSEHTNNTFREILVDSQEIALKNLRAELGNQLAKAIQKGEIDAFEARGISKAVKKVIKMIDENPNDPEKWEKPWGEVTDSINYAYRNKVKEKAEGNYRYISYGAAAVVGAAAVAATGFGLVVGLMALWAVMPPVGAVFTGLMAAFLSPEIFIGAGTLLAVAGGIGGSIGYTIVDSVVAKATGADKVTASFDRNIQSANKVEMRKGINKSTLAGNMYAAFNSQMKDAKTAAKAAERTIVSGKTSLKDSEKNVDSVSTPNMVWY